GSCHSTGARRISSRPRAAPELLTLYRCELRRAWITKQTCSALAAGSRPHRRKKQAAGLGPPMPAIALRFNPCAGCPGVIALHAQGLAPAPRRLDTALREAVLGRSRRRGAGRDRLRPAAPARARALGSALPRRGKARSLSRSLCG